MSGWCLQFDSAGFVVVENVVEVSVRDSVPRSREADHVIEPACLTHAACIVHRFSLRFVVLPKRPVAPEFELFNDWGVIGLLEVG